MPSLPILLAPLALLVPFGIQALDSHSDGVVQDQQTYRQTVETQRSLSPLPLSGDAPGWAPVLEGIEPSANEQVRIDRRVILRISPARPQGRQNLTADLPMPPRMRVVERKMGKCIQTAQIGGVADRGDSLVMFMRDRRTVAAKLEKGCSPRDFYRGFYMENSEDGKICVQRDRLMSRSGAKCQVDSFRELVLEPVE